MQTPRTEMSKTQCLELCAGEKYTHARNLFGKTCMAIFQIVTAAALILSCDSDVEASRSTDDKARVRESADRVLDMARRFEFFADAGEKQKLELESKSLLNYSNPVRGEVYGNVFVWTHSGRPEVLGAIFDFRSENRMDSEFHVLAGDRTRAFRDGKSFLRLDQPGIEFVPLKEAPPPAATAAGRLRQMRDLARDFAVERNHPEQKREFMRLLGQPIYRYSSAAANVVDGAIFVFVEGTDPEAFLLLEAAGEGQPVWRFAFARMNLVEFWGRYRDEEVWHVPPADWNAVFEKHLPYFLVREQPPRGLSRTP
jgi:hypothetical protein